MNIMLSNTRLFRGIGSDELPLLLQCLGAAQKHYDRGETILAEGAPTEQLGMVLTGMAMIGYDDVWGSHSLLGHVGPGEVFAEPYACIPGEPLLISVTASEDTEVLFLNIGKVLTTCTNACPFHAKLIQNLLTVCAAKNLQLSQRILHTTPKGIRARLMSYFSECVKRAFPTRPVQRERAASPCRSTARNWPTTCPWTAAPCAASCRGCSARDC